MQGGEKQAVGFNLIFSFQKCFYKQIILGYEQRLIVNETP